MIEVQLMQHFQQIHQLTVTEHIGIGLTSNVYLAHDGQGRLHAIKVYDFRTIKSGNQHGTNSNNNTTINNNTNKHIAEGNTRLHWQYQIQYKILTWLHNKQKHSKIIQYQQHGVFKYFGYIIMEYVKNSLYTLVCMRYAQQEKLSQQTNGALSSDEIRQIMAQVLLGLVGLSSDGIIHRDLKLENILLTHQNVVKLIDFGTVQLYHSPNQQKQTGQQWQNIVKLDALLNTHDYLVGTKYYLCPELISGKRGRLISPKIDIWAFGVIMYRLLCGNFPFTQGEDENNSRYYTKIRTQQPVYPLSLSENQREVINACLTKDPNLRPSAVELQQYKYFAGIEQSKLCHQPKSQQTILNNIIEFKCICFRRKSMKKVQKQQQQTNQDKNTEPNQQEEQSKEVYSADKNNQSKTKQYAQKHKNAKIQILISQEVKILRVTSKQKNKKIVEIQINLMKITKLNNKVVNISRTDIDEESYTIEFIESQQAEQFIAALMAEI